MLGTTLKGLGEQERKVVSSLAALERPTVTVGDVVSELGIQRPAANLMLSRLARKGWLRRLRRGTYTVVPLSARSAHAAIEDPLATAMGLFAPCYISGWTAAEHWGLTEQVHNAVVVYSARPQRRSTQSVDGIRYRVRHVKPATIFGTTRLWSGTTAIEMADIHRTLIDVLDCPEMGGGGPQMLDIVRAYWGTRAADPDALFARAVRLGRGTVFKRLGFTAETVGRVDDRWLRACRDRLSAGISLLDPGGPVRGPIVSRWRLRINVSTDDAA